MIGPIDAEKNAKEDRLSRAEWIAATALALSVAQGCYVAGVETQRLNDHERRLSALKSSEVMSAGKIETLLVTTTRIDANVAAIADRENERRGNSK